MGLCCYRICPATAFCTLPPLGYHLLGLPLHSHAQAPAAPHGLPHHLGQDHTTGLRLHYHQGVPGGTCTSSCLFGGPGRLQATLTAGPHLGGTYTACSPCLPALCTPPASLHFHSGTACLYTCYRLPATACLPRTWTCLVITKPALPVPGLRAYHSETEGTARTPADCTTGTLGPPHSLPGTWDTWDHKPHYLGLWDSSTWTDTGGGTCTATPACH